MKEQKGITLIALVITIIVLLILAGVSIAMLTGDNGILTQANNSKSESTKAEMVEKANMELNAAYSKILAGEKLTTATDKADAETNIGTSLDNYYDITVTVDETNNTMTIAVAVKTGVDSTKYGLKTSTGTASSTGLTVLEK